MILTDPNLAETIAAEITKRFDDAVPALYDAADRERGWIEFEERNGNTLRTPLVSVSIGIVIAEPGRYDERRRAGLPRGRGQGRRQANARLEVGAGPPPASGKVLPEINGMSLGNPVLASARPTAVTPPMPAERPT